MLIRTGSLALLLLLASRLTGLWRESAQAAAFGATGMGDVAVLMLTFPDWVTGMLASGALAYVLFGLFIHRRFQPHRPPIFAALCAVALPALWAIVPNLVLFFLNKLSWDALQERQLGNIFNVFAMKDRSFIVDHQLCALVMVAIGVVLNLKWFFAQRAAFQPLRREVTAVPPVVATPPPLS